MNKDELVSIYCVTYNHATYIKDALEGFLKQRTEFPIKIYVYDDGSTDETADIVREYHSTYPELIVGIYSDENMYSKTDNYVEYQRGFLKQYIKGKYVALCDGDDYWTANIKLQKQINYMETHPNCYLTAHASKWIDCQKKEEKGYHPYHESRNLTSEELILQTGGNITTASFVMRREVFFPSAGYPKADVGDVPMQLCALNLGSIYYFDEEMCAYRYHRPESWTSAFSYNDRFFIKHIFEMECFYRAYNIYTKGRFVCELSRTSKKNRRNLISKRRGIGWRKFSDYIDDNKEFDEVFTDVKKEQKRIYDMENKIYRLSDDEKEMLNKYRYITIYGNGQYASILRDVFRYNEVEWTGSVISDGGIEKNEDIVWQLKNYPYPFYETIFVVGLHDKWQAEMELEFLKKKDFSWWAPFWVEDSLEV